MAQIGIPPRSPEDWDLPLSRLEADVKALVARQQAAVLEEQIEELRQHALQHIAERGEEPSGQLAECLHQFLDIDPDLRGRDYTTTERTRGGAS